MTKDIPTYISLIAALIAAIILSGCGEMHYSRDQIGFWDQCVKFDGKGVNMATPYGPFNMGWMTWERNVNCGEDINPQPPPFPGAVPIATKSFFTMLPAKLPATIETPPADVCDWHWVNCVDIRPPIWTCNSAWVYCK